MNPFKTSAQRQEADNIIPKEEEDEYVKNLRKMLESQTPIDKVLSRLEAEIFGLARPRLPIRPN